jgi:hypothetical protein
LAFLFKSNGFYLGLGNKSNFGVLSHLGISFSEGLLSDFLLELRDDPGESSKPFVDLLILAATLRRTPGTNKSRHLFEDFTGSRYKEKYLL